MISGLFVAAITYTPFRSLRPSSSVSNVFVTREDPSDWKLAHKTRWGFTLLSSRFGTRASSSSKNMIQGADARARWKTCRTDRSDSPNHYWSVHRTKIRCTLLSNSGPLTDMKFARLSFATAFASNVLPHPGGPQSNTPLGAVMPTAE